MTADNFTATRPLAGAAKNLLDDLAVLDRKIPEELERGVREGYLEAGKVTGLATKLRVPEPRIRTERWVYVEWRQVQSVRVSAYDDADAVAQVKEAYGSELSRGAIPYGFRRSRWEDRESRNDVMISEPTATRPTMDHNLRFYVEPGGEPRSIRRDAEGDKAAAPVEPQGQSVTLDIRVPATFADGLEF